MSGWLPSQFQWMRKRLCNVGPRRARGITCKTWTVSVAGVPVAGARTGVCAGEDGDVRDLRDGQAYVSGVCDAVRRPEAGISDYPGPRKCGNDCGDRRGRAVRGL